MHDRVCVILGCRINLGSLVGLPTHSYQGRDNQSDVEHAWILNPVCYRNTWDNLGAELFAVMIVLICGCWLSKTQCNPEILFQNSLAGHYLLLFSIKRAYDEHGPNFSKSMLSPTTVRCLLYLSGHMTQRVLNQTSKMAPFCPHFTTEAAAEHHFGRVKSRSSNGVMSL